MRHDGIEDSDHRFCGTPCHDHADGTSRRAGSDEPRHKPVVALIYDNSGLVYDLSLNGTKVSKLYRFAERRVHSEPT
jgi:hypothetical protein